MPEEHATVGANGLRRAASGAVDEDLIVMIDGVAAAVRQRCRSDATFRQTLARVLGLEVEPPAGEELARPPRSFNDFFDADLVARRCRLKAAAARWQVDRESLDREAVRPGDELVLSMGRELPDCYLWMCNAARCRSRDARTMALVAAAYEATAEAAQLVGPVDLAAQALGSDAPLGEHVGLVAEAQSMLHAILGAARTPGGFDTDQMSAYVLAKEIGGRRRTFVRFLARDDRADPEAHADLLRRIREADPAADGRREARVAAWLDDLQRTAASDDADAALARARLAVAELVAEGLSAGDDRVARAVDGWLDRLPADADDATLGGPLADALDHAETLRERGAS